MRFGIRTAWCAVLTLAAVGSAALAQDVPADMLAVPCFICHGPRGNSPGDIPSLSGLDAATLTEMMARFRAGDPDATIMSRIAKGYTEAETAAVVEYLTTPEARP